MVNDSKTLCKAVKMLLDNGVESAQFEVRQLAEFVGSAEELLSAVDRRLRGEPLQYILGEWEFWGLPFKVGKGVLIPQPDTERLVECALEQIRGKANPKVLDLCSGSGCVAIALAHERADAQVTAVELYDSAFSYLTENIKLNQVDVKAVKYDVLTEPVGFEKYDIIVSNPPYIAPCETELLSAEVLAEPHEALFGGNDGLEFYRAINNLWIPLLNPDGALLLEIGHTQAASVKEIFKGRQSSVLKDYAGLDRVVKIV